MEIKPHGKATTRTHASLKQPRNSQEQSSEKTPVDDEEAVRASSRFEKMKQKFATLATKSSQNAS